MSERVLMPKDGGEHYVEYASIRHAIRKWNIRMDGTKPSLLTIEVDPKVAVALTQHRDLFALSMTLYARESMVGAEFRSTFEEAEKICSRDVKAPPAKARRQVRPMIAWWWLLPMFVVGFAAGLWFFIWLARNDIV